MGRLFSNCTTAEAIANDLGRSTLIRQRVGLHLMEVAGERAAIRAHLRRQCPRVPGVYGMVDWQGDLIYVGMSGHLQDRLLTYFTKGPAEATEQRVAARAERLMWEVGDHELMVRLRELELIRRWRPRFNALGRPGRREMGIIYLTATEAPNFRVGRRVPRSSRRCWGPLPLTRRTRAAVERLNHVFLLRDCPDRTPIRFREQRTMLVDEAQPGCLRGHVGTCLAPCAGDRSRTEYLAGVARACAFLDGRDRHLVEQLELAMQRAASQQQYEQAASYRDGWQSLQALGEQLHLVRDASGEFAGVHVLQGRSGRTWWVIIAGGRVACIMRRPETPRSRKQFLQLLDRYCSRQPRAETEDFEQMRIISSWYRQPGVVSPEILPMEEARAICCRAAK